MLTDNDRQEIRAAAGRAKTAFTSAPVVVLAIPILAVCLPILLAVLALRLFGLGLYLVHKVLHAATDPVLDFFIGAPERLEAWRTRSR
ncbi:MAG TPA: hypothetical protein VGY48_16005 [Vicinamibacterales bacterium]|nr:hypothetical protein [Vicinamibacterales bacterium]